LEKRKAVRYEEVILLSVTMAATTPLLWYLDPLLACIRDRERDR
jgi:hypothetical protein